MQPKELYDKVVKPLIDAKVDQDALYNVVKGITVDPAAYAKDFCSIFQIAWGDDASPQRSMAEWLVRRYHK